MVEVTMATEWSCGPGCAHTQGHTYIDVHSSPLPRSRHVSSCIPIWSYRCPHKYHPSWFWLAHSRGGRSQLVMVLISHNALQPLAPTAPAASSSIFMSFLMNMQMVGKAAVSRWTEAAHQSEGAEHSGHPVVGDVAEKGISGYKRQLIMNLTLLINWILIINIEIETKQGIRPCLVSI